MAPDDKLPSAEQLSELIAEAGRAGNNALLQGDGDTAATIFTELLGLQPSNPIALCGLGDIAAAMGDTTKAENFYRKAADEAPTSALGHRRLAETYLRQHRTQRALRNLAKAQAAAPDDADLIYMQALAENLSGHKDKTMALLKRTLEMAPNHLQANNDIGCIMAERGDHDAAIPHLEIATANPNATPEMGINLGNALMLASRYDEACAVIERALERQPDDAGMLTALATAERRAGRLDDARLHVEKALAMTDEDTRVQNLAGTIYRELGLFDEAEQYFMRALELAPDDANATSNLGMLRLLKGEWVQGLKDYERRLDVGEFKRPWGILPLPTWDGSDINGKSIIVCSEQGFGDTLQFARFIAPLAARGANVKFAVQPELLRLIEGMDAPFDIVRPNDTLDNIDYQITVMSLPLTLGIASPDEISGAAYLQAPKPSGDIAAALAELTGLKVGINWQGSTLHKENFKRSMTPDDLAPLLAVEGCTFVRLDVGAEGDLPGVTDLRPLINDFADAAAIVDALDLVITVDTATLHLAGALGKPCWGLIAYVADWRYMLGRDDTPWYDSVDLIRQPTPGDWPSVISDAAQRLTTMAR